MKQIYSLALAILTTLGVSAQTTVKLNIDHMLKDQAFAFNQKSNNNLDNPFNVKRLEYYISDISFTHDGGQTTKATGMYILANAGTAVSVDLGKYTITKLEAVNFSIGVDPGVNNQNPTQWGANHALSPKSPSMHWGWAAGYRFVAIEGKTGSNLSTVFEIHALGNDNFFKISIPTAGKADNGDLLVNLTADYAEALSNIDISSGLVIHGETDQAVRLLRNFANTVFTSEEGNKNTLGVSEVKPTIQVGLYPNPSTGTFTITIPQNVTGSVDVSITDLNGKRVLKENMNTFSNNSYAIENKGVYILSIRLDGVVIETKRLLVL
ncbi:MAG: hypothetical protein ACI8SE_001862 [Bacteroidia bacterium]|jgi:hypothetical protein